MPIKTDTAFGFQCPVCGNVQQYNINAFAISAGNGDIFCSSCKIRYANIAKSTNYSVTAGCIDCGEPHTFKVKSSEFWQPQLKTFVCQMSGEVCFFIGGAKQVQDAMNSDFFAEDYEEKPLGIDELSEDFEEIMDHLDLLMQNGAVSCKCGGRQLAMDILWDKIVLICEDCGRSIELPIGTSEDINKLKKIKSIKI